MNRQILLLECNVSLLLVIGVFIYVQYGAISLHIGLFLNLLCIEADLVVASLTLLI